MTTILYFAWVREMIGAGEERVELPVEVKTLSDAVDWLKQRSEGHFAALSNRDRLRAAIDREFSGWNVTIEGAKEIAFFPPVTGG